MESKTFLLTTSFYPPYHIGGDAIHVSYLSRELVARGHEVHVLHSIDAFELKKGKIRDRMPEVDGVYTHAIKSPIGILSPVSSYALGKSRHASRMFTELVREVSPDIVHHHNISLLGVDLLRKRRSYLNFLTAHDYWLVCPRNDLMYRGKRICTTKSCFVCTLASGRLVQPWRLSRGFQSMITELDRIIAPSKSLGSTLAEEFDGGIAHIYNFAPHPPARAPNNDLGEYFLFVGVLEEHKGVKLLLDAFENAETDARLMIVGDGELKPYLRARTRKGKLEDRVLLLDQLSQHELYGLYDKALALVLPSICLENCPLVILEALSMATPVLGSETGGIGEVIRLSGGIVFRPEAARIRDTLERVAQDSENRAVLSSRARESYNRWFSPDAFYAAYTREIERIS